MWLFRQKKRPDNQTLFSVMMEAKIYYKRPAMIDDETPCDLFTSNPFKVST